MSRWLDATVVGMLLMFAAAPFAALFPEPPAFGPQAVGTAALVGILAAVGTTAQAAPLRRKRLLGIAASLLGLTIAATAIRIVWATSVPAPVPTLDLLPKLFALQGEDIDDAVLYEGWLELWLGCALLVSAALGLPRALSRVGRTTPPVAVAEIPPGAPQPWNAATVMLCLVGFAILLAAVLDGHRTADFLSRATHVVGTIADPQDHPRIRFVTADGAAVEFTQNGDVSRPLGARVPVAYLAEDPSGTARADTIWADWSDVLGLLWIGLGFAALPFFGYRAMVRGGRW